MRAKHYTTAVIVFALAGAVRAGDYTFDIPQLVGHYLGDITAIPTYEVEVDLGIEFAQIERASLRLSGTHTPGLAGDLNSPQMFPLSAEILAWSYRTPPIEDVVIDQFLPAIPGQFAFAEPFRALGLPGSAPDFSPWLDGVAEFDFSVYPPMMLAIYYLIEMPSVTITSASLVIEGQPNLDEFMLPGDFDGNGTIDGNDLLAWQRNPSVGALGDWQASYGVGATAGLSTGVVPEPAALGLLAIMMVALNSRRARVPRLGRAKLAG